VILAALVAGRRGLAGQGKAEAGDGQRRVSGAGNVAKHGSRSQVARDRQHPPVVALGGRQAEFAEDAGHVLSTVPRDSAGSAGDAGVGPGQTLMRGYYNNPAATADVLRDDWLHTGDYVHGDDGYYYFHGRSSDLLKPSVDHLSTAEIERVVMEDWAVQGCAAVGVPDSVQAEAIKLYVVRQPGEPLTSEEIHHWCAQRLAEHKRPT
jgi:acyl-CoA synthetase (AMP-forming)/AMP-acid ligase II